MFVLDGKVGREHGRSDFTAVVTVADKSVDQSWSLNRLPHIKIELAILLGNSTDQKTRISSYQHRASEGSDTTASRQYVRGEGGGGRGGKKYDCERRKKTHECKLNSTAETSRCCFVFGGPTIHRYAGQREEGLGIVVCCCHCVWFGFGNQELSLYV